MLGPILPPAAALDCGGGLRVPLSLAAPGAPPRPPPFPASRSVCVVGAGASGLTALKHLRDHGHAATCFDGGVRVGGVYAKAYRGALLTTSSQLIAFSDHSDGTEAAPAFWTADEYLAYLDAYCARFGLFDAIRFRSRVVTAAFDGEARKWRVAVQHDCHVPPHRSAFALGAHIEAARREAAAARGRATPEGAATYTYADHATGEWRAMAPSSSSVREYLFDVLAVCTGTNTAPNRPPEIFEAGFLGDVTHASEYTSADRFAGKRVAVVGLGESGADIAEAVSAVAAATAVAVRGSHGHMIPRTQPGPGGGPVDCNTNRCRYSNPYAFGASIGWANQVAKSFFAGRRTAATQNGAPAGPTVAQTVHGLNLAQGSSAFSKFGCKTYGLGRAIVDHGAVFRRGPFTVRPDGLAFGGDGAAAEDDVFACDAIVACTGYRASLPFFAADAPERAYANPRLLYKHVFPPDFDRRPVAFVGFARPAFGAIPPCAELQARLLARVVSGSHALPEAGEAARVAAADAAVWARRFPSDAARLPSLVDYQLYCDDVAAAMGCLPPLRALAWTKPRLWLKLMLAAFSVHQYRLDGPHRNPRVVERVYGRRPVGNALETLITGGFLAAAWALSWAVPALRPNFGALRGVGEF